MVKYNIPDEENDYSPGPTKREKKGMKHRKKWNQMIKRKKQ